MRFNSVVRRNVESLQKDLTVTSESHIRNAPASPRSRRRGQVSHVVGNARDMLANQARGGNDAPARWTTALIIGGAGIFVLGLLASAVLDPRIRVLHTLQALPYFVVAALARRNSPWGFGAGTSIAAFWNYIWLHQLMLPANWTDWSLLMTLLPAGGHFALIIGCVAAFVGMRPSVPHWMRFIVGGVISVAYLVTIVVITAPQYIGLLRQVFGL